MTQQRMLPIGITDDQPRSMYGADWTLGDQKPKVVVSWGGGVQSTTLSELCISRDPRLLEVTAGVLPDVFLFSDVGDEPAAVYAHIAKMRPRIEAAGFEFRIVTKGEVLSEHVIERATSGRKNISMPPMYVKREKTPGNMPVRRSCTFDFKARVLDKAAKSFFGIRRVTKKWVRENDPVSHWIGISTDETRRAKWSVDPWRIFWHPLLEMGFSRTDCTDFLKSRGIVAPRSACVYCPFHSDAEWRRVKAVPADWAATIAFEKGVHAAWDATGTIAGLRTKPYLHKSRQPIELVAFDGSDENEDEECSGNCGL